ncbi:MAG: hypothetical protein KDA24_00255 [Deltaproteobacteria bacterium]|nr:hypothetical protein [Deltaproteobacteria bacterium]
MNRTLTTLLAASLLALAGCGGSEPASDPAPEPAAEAPVADEAPANNAPAAEGADALISLAAALRANPGDADKLLSEAGMTLEQFEAAMFELAKDPAKASAFTAALQ